MGYSIPRQQPAVVLRSQFNWLRATLAVALSCVAGLTIAIGIVAGSGDERTTSARGAPPAQLSQTGYAEGTRGPLPAQLPKTSFEPGTRGPLPAQLPKAGYDGGPVSRYEGEARYFIVPSTGYHSGEHRPQVSHPGSGVGPVGRYDAETKHLLPSDR